MNSGVVAVEGEVSARMAREVCSMAFLGWLNPVWNLTTPLCIRWIAVTLHPADQLPSLHTFPPQSTILLHTLNTTGVIEVIFGWIEMSYITSPEID